MFVLAITLLIQLVLAAEPTPAAPAPAFDEVAAKARYATFIIRWYEALDFDEIDARDGKPVEPRWPSTTPSPPPTTVARWPIGARGLYGNSPRNRTRLAWVGQKLPELPAEIPEAVATKIPELLAELFLLWDYCYESSAEPSVCVPGACYFVPRCEYERDAYWLALRDGANGPELVGVLLWKEDRPEPTKDPQLGKWLAGIEKGLAAPPPK